MAYGDSAGVERNLATGVAELADGEKGLGNKGWHNVNLASCKREAWQVKLSGVSRVHYIAIWVSDGDGFGGEALVMDWHGSGAEMGGTAGVGDGRSGI